MEGSTPTWTEGTPSFTESSSSENEIGEFITVEKLDIQTEPKARGLVKFASI